MINGSKSAVQKASLSPIPCSRKGNLGGVRAFHSPEKK